MIWHISILIFVSRKGTAKRFVKTNSNKLITTITRETQIK